MSVGREAKPDERGLSARYLVLVFLMGVAACAVFFSLGFVIGYNERMSRRAVATEEVIPSPLVPPAVSPAPEAGPVSTKVVDRSGADVLPARTPATRPESSPESAPGEARTAAARTSGASAASRAGSQEAATEVPGGYTVQVAASRDHRDAERLVKELRGRGYAVFLLTPEYARANDNLFRVQVGPFATREEAEEIRAKLVKEGFKPFIRH